MKKLSRWLAVAIWLLGGLCADLSAQTSGINSGKEASDYCRLLSMPVKPLLAQAPKSYLGIYHGEQKIDQPPSPYPEATYIQVAGVIKGSPADMAGLKKDDVILGLDDQPTCQGGEKITTAFKKAVEKKPIGSRINLKILRGKKILALSAKTVQRPSHQQPEAVHPEEPICSRKPSLLQKGLSDNGSLSVFEQTVRGLYVQSNQIHNPGFDREMPYHPLQLTEATYLLRHPLNAGIAAQTISRKLTEPLQDANRQLNAVFCRAAALSDTDVVLCTQPPEEISFPALIRALEKAAEDVRRVTGIYSAETQALIRKKALNPEDDKQWNDFLEWSLKLDRTALYRALAPLTAFLTEENLDRLKRDLEKRFDTRQEGILYETRTAAGLVMVGGRGPKVYHRDAALILDLGGRNLYTNNAGGTRPDIPVALVIDWGGHNRYIASENFSQGAGLLGGGFLIDLGGHSTFIALDGSQGAGFAGVGILYHGEGASVLHARENAQGVGQAGIGLLVGRGRGEYSCLYKGQGLGLFGGAGILINQAGGNVYQLGGLRPDFRDPEHSTQSMGQGFGFGIRAEGDQQGVPGGIGVLIDQKGGNTYIADYFAQGSAYFYGVGILDNKGDRNRYMAGRYAQGAGIHTAVGVLQNSKGANTFYSSVGVSQGMGHDYGVGFLKNGGNENLYRGGVLIQGAATHGGIGILIDEGPESRMERNTKGQGYADDEDCLGLLFSAANPAGKTTLKIGVNKDRPASRH